MNTNANKTHNMNTTAQATTVTPGIITPVDALWTLIQSQTKAVRKALVKRILDEEAKLDARQAKLGNSQQSAKARQKAKPYTLEELNARIGCAEADIAAGRVISRAEASERMKNHISQHL